MRKDNNIFNEENLTKEAPLLTSIPKRNPYTVPEGYFDELPSAIMERCRETKAIPSLGSKIFWLFRPQWMMAVFGCIICLTLITRNNTNPAPQSFQAIAETVSDSAIYQSLADNIETVDVNALEDAVQSDNVPAVTAVPQRTDTTHNQQEIINYLMNHNVDANDIEDAL